MSSDDQIAFWRTLAGIRARELRRLHARIADALELVPDSHFRRVAAALGERNPGWMQELERLETSAELSGSDVLTMMDDLWTRVAAGRGE